MKIPMTLILAIKYWLQGDDWDEAWGLAHRLVYGWRE